MTSTKIWKQKRKVQIEKRLRAIIICSTGLALTLSLMISKIQIDAQNADTTIPVEYISIIENECNEKNLCVEFIEAMIEAESSGNEKVISKAGCVGLMQISPKYSGYSIKELQDPEINIRVGTDIVLELFEKYGDCFTVLMAYNEGEYGGAIERAERGDYSKYSEKIVKRAEQLERIHYK